MCSYYENIRHGMFSCKKIYDFSPEYFKFVFGVSLRESFFIILSINTLFVLLRLAVFYNKFLTFIKETGSLHLCKIRVVKFQLHYLIQVFPYKFI